MFDLSVHLELCESFRELDFIVWVEVNIWDYLMLDTIFILCLPLNVFFTLTMKSFLLNSMIILDQNVSQDRLHGSLRTCFVNNPLISFFQLFFMSLDLSELNSHTYLCLWKRLKSLYYTLYKFAIIYFFYIINLLHYIVHVDEANNHSQHIR